MSSREELIDAVAKYLLDNKPDKTDYNYPHYPDMDLALEAVTDDFMASKEMVDYWKTIKGKERAVKMLRTAINNKYNDYRSVRGKKQERRDHFETNLGTVVVQKTSTGYRACMFINAHNDYDRWLKFNNVSLWGKGETPDEAINSLRTIAYEEFERAESNRY